MQKMMTILYPVKTGLYVNLTNRCPCACTFCIRNNADKVYDEPDSLWLEHEPSFEEVKAAFAKEDMTRYTEVVFCGYGEPTEALETLLQTARFVKETYALPTRLNTNGLGSLINKKDIAPLFKGLFDAVSISLNSSSEEIYLERIRPIFKEKAYPAMLEFARECKKYVPDVTMTTVHTTITEQDEEECTRICKELGVNYRIREFVPPAK
ncbi:MAG: radical SAM protein [Treponema sp.]|nr:radical SAM protein [Treponema sp.]